MTALLDRCHACRAAYLDGVDCAAELRGLRLRFLKERERAVWGWKKCMGECGRFWPDTAYQGTRGRICLACRAERKRLADCKRSRAYYARNLDACKAAMRQDYQERKPEYRRRTAKWLAENYDRHLELKRAWRTRNRERINAATRARYHTKKQGRPSSDGPAAKR